jgi:hypothetical protein
MSGTRAAVAVGINDYEDVMVGPILDGAENDAREVFARLQQYGNFEVDRTRHLLLGEQATSENIRRAISDLFWKKDRCDIAIFYFAGHGFLDDYGNSYIAPWDHEYDEPLVHGIRLAELRDYFLANNNNAEALLILDCSHSGVASEPQKGKGRTGLSGRFYASLTGNQTPRIGPGKFILASSGADGLLREWSAAHEIPIFDKKGDWLRNDELEMHAHGVMTFYLLEGMNGRAAEDEEVRIGKLYDYVTHKVNAYREGRGHKDSQLYDFVHCAYQEGLASKTVLVKAPDFRQPTVREDYLDQVRKWTTSTPRERTGSLVSPKKTIDNHDSTVSGHDIFISYASEDRQIAEALASAFRDKGWSVWLDHSSILPGQTYDKVIEAALQAAKCVVVLWSETSVESNWVKDEANVALGRRILIPAQIEDAKIPMGFRGMQIAPLADWKGSGPHHGLEKLVKSVANILGKQRH